MYQDRKRQHLPNFKTTIPSDANTFILNLHHDSHITINNDTTGSILKFQTQDAENVIDWIDSLKSRFHDLKTVRIKN